MNIGQNIPWAGPNDEDSLAQTFPNIGKIITLLLQNAITLAGIILLFLLIFGGINLIIGAGQGDPKKAAQGKQAITSALVGFAIVFLAYFIIQLIEVITGAHILYPPSNL